MRKPFSGAVRLNLGLQGGGAHGAFSWGVLDALLEDERIEFEGVSGTSAGAMNAVLLAQGLMEGGRTGARQTLARFWQTVAERSPFDLALGGANDTDFRLNPAVTMWMGFTQYLSPAQLNPFDFNPLRDILGEQVDFAALRERSPVRLFIAATHANSGKLRLFRTAELSADAVLASACLPTVQRAVMIEGEPYWDGGYSANPAVFPLVYEVAARDTLLVLLTPLRHAATPESASEIKLRTLDVAFNASFLREMRTFADLRDVARRSWLHIGRLERRIARARFHVIAADELINALGTETKLAVNSRFFDMLRDQGRTHAQRWLAAHGQEIGRQSTIDLRAVFC